VGWPQIVFGVVLIVVLFATALYFVISQRRTLRQLADDPSLSSDELLFQQRQALRRLAAGIVMLLIAVLLFGALAFLEAPAQARVNEIDALPDPENRPPLTPEQKTFDRIYGWTWMAILVLLLVLVLLGLWDYLANRRYGLQQRREINEARRKMIAREADRLRRE
jgi:hypothetical protein